MNRRAKIEALAADHRGDPATRALARRWLDRHPEPAPKPTGVVHGVMPSAEYVAWRKAQHIPKRR